MPVENFIIYVYCCVVDNYDELTDIPPPYFAILAFYNQLILNNFVVLSYFYANP